MADPVKIDVTLKGGRAAVVKALRGMADSLDLDAPPPSPPETPARPEDPEDDPREREYVIVQTTVETLAHGEVPTCECGNDAVCVGVTEGRLETLAVMCDECCGHGNEDGWCVPLEKFYPSKRRTRAPETPAPEGAADLRETMAALRRAGRASHMASVLHADSAKAQMDADRALSDAAFRYVRATGAFGPASPASAPRETPATVAFPNAVGRERAVMASRDNELERERALTKSNETARRSAPPEAPASAPSPDPEEILP